MPRRLDEVAEERGRERTHPFMGAYFTNVPTDLCAATIGEMPSSVCIIRKVRDTIPHVQELSDLHNQVGKALSQRKDKMSRKRRTKERTIHIGELVLISDFPVTGAPEKSSFVLDHGSIASQEDGVFASQNPCLVTDGASSSGTMSSDVQNPEGRLVSEPDTHSSVPAGSAVSSRGIGR
ncbi:hypothetical protein NDU88_000683 [Pleurodeles waltl]|uniref:Uncharacterized protein n=1 Tax=Pleurodeles waltl TaxID=8319 RepID=A0AAV7TGK8_PLEWA|nr:hypothetical protein NDU88_000683 [Pleurodeles waltl]